jgi:hypothetical protein
MNFHALSALRVHCACALCVAHAVQAAHKRFLLHLEQVIMKNKAHASATGIKERQDGIDFYFSSRADVRTVARLHALTKQGNRFTEVLNGICPVLSIKRSEVCTLRVMRI